MLNIETFNNLVNLVQNANLDENTRITIASQNARTGKATFATTETNVFTRLAERVFRSDDAKASYGNVRAQLLKTLTDLFGVKNEDHLPSAVRAAFVYGETACDRPLTQRRLTAVMTAAAQALGYAGLADMQHGVGVRHARHLSAHLAIPEALKNPGQHANDVIDGRRVSEMTQAERNEIIQIETAKKFDRARDIMLDGYKPGAPDSSDSLDESEVDDYESDDEEDLEEDGEYMLPEFDGVNAEYTADDLKKMAATGQEYLGYYNTVEDELRAAKDINERRSSDLTMKFEKTLQDPVKAAKAVNLLYGMAACAKAGKTRLADLLASIHESMLNVVKKGTPDQVAKLAKFLAKLGDFDPDDGKSIHNLIKAYGHMKYVDKTGRLHAEEIGKDVDYVDDLYAAMMKRINANIKARLDQENLSSAEKKDLAAKMNDLVLKLNPFGSDSQALSDDEPTENRRIALDNLLNVARLKPNFNVKASVDSLAEISAAATDGKDHNDLLDQLEMADDAQLMKDLREVGLLREE